MTRTVPCLVASLLAPLSVGGGLVPLVGAATVLAEPSAHAQSRDWEFDFLPGELRHFVDPVDGKAYWYLTYRVVNRTGSERMWAPTFQLYGDRGQLLSSGREVPARVTKALIDKAGTPFTQDQYQILGELRVGEENAKDGLVVFPSPDPEITELTLFVGGISSRINRDPDPVSGEPRTRRRHLRLDYLMAGEAAKQVTKPATPASTDERVRDGAEKRPAPPGAPPGTEAGCWEWR